MTMSQPHILTVKARDIEPGDSLGEGRTVAQVSVSTDEYPWVRITFAEDGSPSNQLIELDPNHDYIVARWD